MLGLSQQSDHQTVKPHNTIQALGSPNCLSSQTSTLLSEVPWLTNKLFSPVTFSVVKQSRTFVLFFCAIWFSFHTDVFLRNVLQRLFWIWKVRVPIAHCIHKGCLEAYIKLSCSKMPLSVLVCFHLLFTMDERFTGCDQLTHSITQEKRYPSYTLFWQYS